MLNRVAQNLAMHYIKTTEEKLIMYFEESSLRYYIQYTADSDLSLDFSNKHTLSK